MSTSSQDYPQLSQKRSKKALGWRKPVPPLLDAPQEGISRLSFLSTRALMSRSSGLDQPCVQGREEPLPNNWREKIVQVLVDDHVRGSFSVANMGPAVSRRREETASPSSSSSSLTLGAQEEEEECSDSETKAERRMGVVYPDDMNPLDFDMQPVAEPVGETYSPPRPATPPRPSSRRRALQINTRMNASPERPDPSISSSQPSRRTTPSVVPPSPVRSSLTRRPTRHQPYRRPSLWNLLCTQPRLQAADKRRENSTYSAGSVDENSQIGSVRRARRPENRRLPWLCR